MQRPHRMAGQHAGAAGLDPVLGGAWKQRPQIHPGQQQVRAAAPAQQCVVQHAQKHAPAGLIHRRVEGRHAQRLDELAHQRRRQAGAQRGHAGVRVALKAAAPPAQRRAQQRPLVAPRPAARAQDAAGGVPRRGPVGQGQAAAVRVGQCQRAAQQRLRRIDAHRAHQAQAVGVGADQDVLAVVHCYLAAVGQPQRHAARAPAGLGRGLEDGDRVAPLHRVHRRRHAGPAGADNRHAQGGFRGFVCGQNRLWRLWVLRE